MMTMDERADLLRRTMDALWNRGDLEACDALFAEHCMFHDPTFPIDGLAGLKEFARDLRAAQPDLHMDIHDIVTGEDMTAHRYTFGGTASSEFRGIPATGKSYVMTGMGMSKWEGDRIVEDWIVYDMLGVLQQLGLVPERITHETSA